MEDKRLKLEGLCCKNDDFFELVEVTLEAANAARLGLLFSDEATEAAARLFIRLSVNDFSSGRQHYLSLMKILKKRR